jgi:hypothetical protein
LLQRPIKELTFKLSSLRSPSNKTPNSSSSAKPGIFNPLRSLPWFQHTRFDFERTQRDDDFAMDGLERAGDDHRRSIGNEDQRASETQRRKADGSTSREAATGSPSGPMTPVLRIEMRHSLDQNSFHMHDSNTTPRRRSSESSSTNLVRPR